MANVWPIKKGDRLPSVTARLTSAAGGLASATGVTFAMEHQTSGAIVTGAAVIVSATDKVLTVRYDWAATNTDVTGKYNAEWVVTIGGKEQTFPPDTFNVVEVFDDVS
jgi:hypothetical protein